MSDRRPFTREDDQYILAADAANVPHRQMARTLRRSAASIQGRLRNLRAETSRAERRLLCLRCYKGGVGVNEALATSGLLADG